MRSRWLACLTMLAAASLAACEIEKVGVPPTRARIAMHAVLSPTASSQVVLLEQTRNGTLSFFGPPFDVEDPVVSGNGEGLSGAFMALARPSGDTIYAVEDIWLRGDGKGAGVYRFSVGGAGLEPGPYTLIVLTNDGHALTARTTLPAASKLAAAADARDFDRARDTLRLAWAPVAGARAYWVRVESPFGPRAFFTESTSVRLPGGLRNVDAVGLPRLFIPGFQQAVTVSAVDSNFYDWYRSSNDAFSGAGLVNRVDGGIGVFGSLSRLRFEDLRVLVPQVEPATGNYTYTASPGDAPPIYLGLELYLESKASRSDQGDLLSGRYFVRPRFGYSGCYTCGLFATRRGTRLDIAFLRDWSGRDTVEQFSGEVRGDTLVGSYRFAGGVVRFVRQR